MKLLNAYDELLNLLANTVTLSVKPVNYELLYLKEYFKVDHPKVQQLTVSVYDLVSFITDVKVPIHIMFDNKNMYIRYTDQGEMYITSIYENEFSKFEENSLYTLKLVYLT